jgi:hypothetical protein
MKVWAWPGAVIIAAFVVTRLPALALHAHDTDVNIYARYAAEWHAANRSGESFYELHRRRVEAEAATGTPEQAAAQQEYKAVEYPPLAVAVMALPAVFVDDPFDGEFPAGPPPRYARAFFGMLALFDVAVLLLVFRLVRRLYPDATPWETCERCLLYVVGSWPLYAILYARLDLGVSLAIMASLALLVSGRHWAWALVVLALGVHFKLMPLVLAPVFVVASLPAAITSWREAARGLALRGAVFAGFGLGLLGVFYALLGPGIVEFLGYHKDRGIEIESTWSTLLLAARPFGGGWEVFHSHGSVNVRSGGAAWLPALATLTMIGSLLGASALFVVAARRQRPGDGTIAQSQPRLVAGFALLLMASSIATNKVFSPQYVLWTLPLAALVDFKPVARRWFFLGTLAVNYLTMRIFPDCFVGEIVYRVGESGGLPLFAGPTVYGACLLLARNSLFLLLTATLAWRLLAPHRVPCPRLGVGMSSDRLTEPALAVR